LTELFYPHVGGTEYRLYEIARRLVERGHEIDVFTMQYPPSTPGEEYLEGIYVHRYARSSNYVTANGLRSVRGIFKYSISTALRTLGTSYDIYYFGQWPILHALLTRPLVSPCIQEWCEVWYRKIVILEKALARAMHNHVAVSNFTKRRMVEFLNLDPMRITVIPNGVDPKKFRNGSYDKVWGRLVYVGRIAPHKGLDILIDAFKIIRDEASEVELFIAGSGPLLSKIKEYAKGLEGVHILGYISEAEKVELLRSSWLFTIPSSREGFPLAPLEAMASGTPVLTVDQPENGVKDICTQGNGVVVPPDSLSIAQTVLKLLSDEDRWDAMRRASLRYTQQYDWDTIVSQAERYFDLVVNGA
jgi:glycosyltransferase involved in cell wall biosynthesis